MRLGQAGRMAGRNSGPSSRKPERQTRDLEALTNESFRSVMSCSPPTWAERKAPEPR